MSVIKSLRWFVLDDGKQARLWRRWAKIIFLLALFVGLFWIVPIRKVIQAVFGADPFLLAVGLVLGFLSTVLTAAEIEPLTRNQGIRHGFWKILEINLAVKFYSQFTPTTLVGSGLRWYRLAQPGNKTAEALAALAFFRVLETFLTITTGLGFWALAGQTGLQANIAGVTVVIVLIVVGWIVATRKSVPLYRWFKSHGGGFLERQPWMPVGRRIEKYLIAVSTYAGMPAADLLLAVAAGLASVLTGILSGLFLAHSIGIRIGYLEMGWIQAVVLLTTQLPFVIAGGIGVREVTLVTLLAMFGVGAELALAFSFLIFVRGVLIALVGGVLEGIQSLRSPRMAEPDTVHNQPKET